MSTRLIGLVLATILLAALHPVEGQQPAKIPLIAYLPGSSPSAMSGRTEAFRQGLREFGYLEGKTIIIEWRSSEGKRDRAPALATELIRLNVDVIVTAA